MPPKRKRQVVSPKRDLHSPSNSNNPPPDPTAADVNNKPVKQEVDQESSDDSYATRYLKECYETFQEENLYPEDLDSKKRKSNGNGNAGDENVDTSSTRRVTREGKMKVDMLQEELRPKVLKQENLDFAEYLDFEKRKGKGIVISENAPLSNAGDVYDSKSWQSGYTAKEDLNETSEVDIPLDDTVENIGMSLHTAGVFLEAARLLMENEVEEEEVEDKDEVEDEEEGEEQVQHEILDDATDSMSNWLREWRRICATYLARPNTKTRKYGIDGSSTAAKVEADDWPAQFSAAMKKLKDQRSKDELLCVSRQSVTALPRKLLSPSLVDLCLYALVKNADAISSLTGIPDILRHKLCQLLSDSRKMNGNIFRLLLAGSPVEIRVTDTSWLTENNFTKFFAKCNTSNLKVLQLDQCGQCITDYVLHGTLARPSKNLPVLAALSLQGACRLSDTGLTAIVSAAPRLQSINLNQCNLVTSAGIQSLIKSLGSILRELYIDDCYRIDLIECLPFLRKVKCLEVLSVAGIDSVSDHFIEKLMIMHGRCLKEIILENCMRITDRSLKAIAENSSSLCALNLVAITNVTDIGLGYLANGILKFKIMKFRGNAFSDEAVAAFVDITGDSLEELSLNNIKMVGRNTAVSLARHSRKLVTLDVSWCRKLTDDALRMIVDRCDSLRILKFFGCTQITDVFFNGHTNMNMQVIGRRLAPIVKHINEPYPVQSPLRYSAVLPVDRSSI